MNKAQLLQRQLGIKDSGRAGDDTLREASRRFLAPPLAWKPTPGLLSRLEQEGYWPELVEHFVPVFIIEIIEQNIALQNIDSFFVEYVMHRLLRDEGLGLDLVLVKRALFLLGLHSTAVQLDAAKALYEKSLPAGQSGNSAGLFRFCVKYAGLILV